MTITPSTSPKITASAVVLGGLAVIAVAYVLHLLQQPVADAGWRHSTTVAAPAPLASPMQSRGSRSQGTGETGVGETSFARARN